jgi:hypothetical protein
MDGLESSRDPPGDSSSLAPPATPASGELPKSPRNSHPTQPAPAPDAAGSGAPPDGPPPPLLQAQGFFAKHAPRMPPGRSTTLLFFSPGDALLQFIMENFSSQVCTPVAPGSPLFAPSPVYIDVCRDDHLPVPLASFCNVLQYWVGSSSERLVVSEVSPNVFRLLVASPRIALFLVSLGGFRYGKLLALFFSHLPTSNLVLAGLRSVRAQSPPLTGVPSLSVPLVPSGPACALLSNQPTPCASFGSPLNNSASSTSALPIGKDPILPGKRRRPPLCLFLLQPGILPRPAGPLPWPVHLLRDLSSASSSALPDPLPTLACPTNPLPILPSSRGLSQLSPSGLMAPALPRLRPLSVPSPRWPPPLVNPLLRCHASPPLL